MNTTIRAFLLVGCLSFLFVACNETIAGLELPEVEPDLVIFFDDFDDENSAEGALNWTDFDHFDVISGCVDLHGNGFYDVQPGNGLYVDMDGTCEEAGTIQTKETFEFFPNTDYVLEFWLAGNHRIDRPDTLDVSLGSLYDERFILQRNDEFEHYERSFTVGEPTDAKLRFEHYGGDDQGILVDLIRIRLAE